MGGKVRCPKCREKIRAGALKCNHCGSEFESPLEKPKTGFSPGAVFLFLVVAIGAVAAVLAYANQKPSADERIAVAQARPDKASQAFNKSYAELQWISWLTQNALQGKTISNTIKLPEYAPPGKSDVGKVVTTVGGPGSRDLHKLTEFGRFLVSAKETLHPNMTDGSVFAVVPGQKVILRHVHQEALEVAPAQGGESYYVLAWGVRN